MKKLFSSAIIALLACQAGSASAITLEQLYGTWNETAYGAYSSGRVDYPMNMEGVRLQASTEEGCNVAIVGLFKQEYPINATFDEAAQTITFGYQILYTETTTSSIDGTTTTRHYAIVASDSEGLSILESPRPQVDKTMTLYVSDNGNTITFTDEIGIGFFNEGVSPENMKVMQCLKGGKFQRQGVEDTHEKGSNKLADLLGTWAETATDAYSKGSMIFPMNSSNVTFEESTEEGYNLAITGLFNKNYTILANFDEAEQTITIGFQKYYTEGSNTYYISRTSTVGLSILDSPKPLTDEVITLNVEADGKTITFTDEIGIGLLNNPDHPESTRIYQCLKGGQFVKTADLPTGMNEMQATDRSAVDVYTIDGTCIARQADLRSLQLKGIYVVKAKNGSKKMIF